MKTKSRSRFKVQGSRLILGVFFLTLNLELLNFEPRSAAAAETVKITFPSGEAIEVVCDGSFQKTVDGYQCLLPSLTGVEMAVGSKLAASITRRKTDTSNMFRCDAPKSAAIKINGVAK
jgi:hypothetical protein